KSKGEVFNDCKEIDAISGENEISITAFNKDNTVQGYMQTAKFTSAIKQEEPHLYILSIGIDQYKDSTISLKYAVKDSNDIKDKLIKQAETLYKPQNIHHIMLKDSEAAKSKILGKISELSRKIKPTDSFILFVAGHGVLLQNQYYMLTHEYDGKVNENTMISSNEIVEISKKIKSLSQLFIFDTCHAGGVDYIVSGLYDARMSVLAKKMGLHIYASANSKEAAMDGYQGNGLFTYTLLDGLNNKKEADKNKDNKISLVELGEYTKQTTTEISKKIGHQQTPLIINFGKDNPVYNLR
ncbi:MAG: caspase family protein, partial [Nitrospirota bacterium]